MLLSVSVVLWEISYVYSYTIQSLISANMPFLKGKHSFFFLNVCIPCIHVCMCIQPYKHIRIFRD